MMNVWKRFPWVTLVLALVFTRNAASEEPAEPRLRSLPPGIFVQSSVLSPAPQREAIGKKLGGQIARLTNSVLHVHGRKIQVNMIEAADEVSAKNILISLEQIKPSPFCLRKGNLVVEYVGANVDSALAIKTTYELGLQPKPAAVRYRITAELATVDKADYMACNTLFQQFLLLHRGNPSEAESRIQTLAKSFQFGSRLTLRNPTWSEESMTQTFLPPPVASEQSNASISYAFDAQDRLMGVPYVVATIETTAEESGFRSEPSLPEASLTAATPHWPAADPALVELAKKITSGNASNDAKAQSILEWLTPGRNLKYTGETGSRWGARKVFEQRFGHCWDFSDCFVTLARAAGVPCRQVAGWFYGSSGHVWAEYYREGRGWQQVDPTGGGLLPCGIYHIAYFATEDGEMPIVYVSMPQIEVLSHP